MFALNRKQIAMPASYTPSDLQDEWEFKIIQSGTLAFRKPETLQSVREEEAQAGWVLLEKLDDAHLRFKRLASAKANDHNLSFDAYRTKYGASVEIRLLIFMAIIMLGAIAMYLYFTSQL